MKKMRIKLAAVAFILTIGTTYAAQTIADGWYVPDYTTGQTPRGSAPSNCNDFNVLCATHYTSGSADQQVYKAN